MQSVKINVTPTTSRMTRYNFWVSYVCGSIQMAVGVLCIVINSVGILKLVTSIYYIGIEFYIGHGIWGGVFVRFIHLLTHIIVLKFCKTKCYI